MKDYENINDNCKILWREGYKLNGEKYTQVSGYIFNEKNEMLIVRNDNTWTIPGGHPEKSETEIETLNREVMEEACVTIKDINYLGAVEVIEGEKYFQLRYTAKVNEILPFKQEWEICERQFVKISELPKYIKWANGIAFSEQINSAFNFWKENK